jgi:UDPglucose 6-dehydrogenase
MKKIGVMGKGVVGTAVHDGLKYLGHSVSFYDPKYPESKITDILDSDVVFICVPTNQAADGSCDTSIVELSINELDILNYKGLVAIKSTIEPGTAAKLQDKHANLKICSVPEFLRANTALADFIYNHDLLVIGTTDPREFELIKEIHGHLPKLVVQVSPTEAEVIKYFNNVHHAMSIVFANITYEVCKKLGSDYNNVYSAITKRECFNPAYLLANENLRGYGGHCLPKDTSAYNYLINKLGLDFSLINSVIKDNEKFK